MQKGRQRGRNNNQNNGNRRNYSVKICNNVFDSNGPGGRIRGTASQIVEKYLSLARDASAQDDKVLAESFYQYAEHYCRIVNINGERERNRRAYEGENAQPNVDLAGSEQPDIGDAMMEHNLETNSEIVGHVVHNSAEMASDDVAASNNEGGDAPRRGRYQRPRRDYRPRTPRNHGENQIGAVPDVSSITEDNAPAFLQVEMPKTKITSVE